MESLIKYAVVTSHVCRHQCQISRQLCFPAGWSTLCCQCWRQWPGASKNPWCSITSPKRFWSGSRLKPKFGGRYDRHLSFAELVTCVLYSDFPLYWVVCVLCGVVCVVGTKCIRIYEPHNLWSVSFTKSFIEGISQCLAAYVRGACNIRRDTPCPSWPAIPPQTLRGLKTLRGLREHDAPRTCSEWHICAEKLMQNALPMANNQGFSLVCETKDSLPNLH